MDYDYLIAPIRVKVPTYKESKTEANTYFYTIELESKDNKWYVEKRFSEFDNLAKALKVNFHNLPNLPNKSFLFKLSQKDLDQRRKGLEEFLQKIVVRNDLMNSELVKQFLQLDKNAAEIMVTPPRFAHEYPIDGQTKGIREYFFLQQENLFFILTTDLSPVNRFNAKVSNTRLPWEGESKSFMEIATVEAWIRGDSSGVFLKKWSKGYPQQTSCISYDAASNALIIGLDDGVVDVIRVSQEKYDDVVCAKVHQSRVTGALYDSLNHVAYTTSTDKQLRVNHGTSLSQIVSIPHKDPLISMLADTIKKRLFIGSKGGEVYIYDISNAEKPKSLNVLSNTKHGPIRALYLELSRNYLFTASGQDGQINVFDLDKPGREKFARLNATIYGKEKARSVLWTGRRAEIVCGTADGSITFYDVSGKPIYVLQAFDSQIVRMEYLPESETILAASKGKNLKMWVLPKEWRSAKLIAQESKIANKLVTQHNKTKIIDSLRKANEDSDEDDLAGWHLD